MKKLNHITFVLITALGVSSLMSSCNEKKQVLSDDMQEMQAENDANDRIAEMRETIRREKEEFIVQARAKIDKNKKDIENLRIVSKTKAGEAKVKYEIAIEDLKAENERLEAKIEQNKESVDEKWDNFKEEFNSDMDKLGTAIKDLFKDNS